jgi:short-subunit dehydrogenase
MNFENKTIIITGASSGIGYNIAELLLEENCRLIVAARRVELLNLLLRENSQAKVIPVKCDVSKKEDVKNVFEIALEGSGKIDLAILNSGIDSKVTIKDFSAQKGEEVFNVNFFGVVNFLELLIPHFIKNNGGVVAGVSSLADTRGFTGSGFYSASKAALSHLLESLRVEGGKFNIKVITVRPGFVTTPMTENHKFDMAFLIDSPKAAKIILDGIRKEKNIIQFPFPTVFFSKIVKMLPNFLFDFFMKKHLKKIS